MDEIGWAGLGIVPTLDSSFDRNLGRQLDPRLDRVGRTSGKRFGGILGKAGMAAAAGAIGAGFAAYKVGKDSIEQASDLNESLNAVNVTYEKQADAVQKLGEKAADSLGLSNSEFNSLAVRFSAFSQTIAGDDSRKIVSTLDDLTTRAADFASVMNLEVNEAAQLFQSGLAGETEPLRRYGLDLSAAAVKAHAYAEGIADSGKELTESEKVQARYSLLMKQTSKTQGDFKNTSDDLANVQRRLSARWDDAQAKLGTALLPIMEDVTGFILDHGIPAFEKFGDWFADDGMAGLEKFGTFTKDEILPVVEDLGGFLKDAAEFGGDVVKALGKLPDPAKYAALAALVGGGAALKMRGGGAGAMGGAGRALGLAKPVPVFVTNPGFGGAGGKTPVVAGGTTSKVGKAAKFAGKAFLPAALFAAGYEVGGKEFGQGAIDANVGVLGGNIQGMKKDAEAAAAAADSGRASLDGMAQAFTDANLPAALKTEIAMTGLPETKRELRALVREYDLTPKKKETLFELAGFDLAMQRLKRINAELDWVARPREARISITKAYADAGYETRGGLQEGGGTVTTQRRAALGGYP